MRPTFLLRRLADGAATVLVVALTCAAPNARGAVPAVPSCLEKVRHVADMPRLPDVPKARLATLSRGINITDLFDPKASWPIEPALRRLRAAGLRHVRIPVSPDVFTSGLPAWQPFVLHRLDELVCTAVKQNIGVIIDLHPFSPLAHADEPFSKIADRLCEIWRKLAARYAGASTDLVFFEILNEPKIEDPAQWEAIQGQLARAIRSVAPASTLIATASPWSTAAALVGSMPLRDRNAVYAFHLYTPMIFTHQGASWSWPDYSSVRDLAFPARADNVARVARHAVAERQAELSAYARDFQNARRVEDEIATAADWARHNGRTVIVTEFGVYGKVVPESARSAWLRSVRQALEANGVGWTVWEYRGGFGIAGDLQSGCVDALSAARALDLCAP